ncbi:MAG: hypothetical protein ACXQS3_02385 [Candidatus Methanofastidiosia archaeon]
MSDDDIKMVLERYSGCKICNRENTKLCEDAVDYTLRQVYFTAPFKRLEDEMTRYCKFFKLSTSKLNKVLCELSEINENEKVVQEKTESCAF